MSLDAYQRRQIEAESPRETEYRLMGRVTAALLDAERRELKGSALMKALDWNRRMWTALATDCAAEGNALPPETRAGIVSLSIYVSRTTGEVMRGKAEIEDLISINRTIMKGLEPKRQERPVEATAAHMVSGGLTG